MILETDRLRLVPVRATDVDILHRIWTDPDVRRYLWDDVIIDRDTAQRVVDATVADWNERGYGLWLIWSAATEVAALDRRGAAPPQGKAATTVAALQKVLGFVGFRSSSDVPELVYGLLPSAWHRGIATEAAQAALQYIFERAESVWAATDVPNTASVLVLKRLGMEFVEQKGNTVFYRLRTARRFATSGPSPSR